MKKFIALLLILSLALSGTAAFACTGFYVGKDASANGTIIIGHTVDAWNTAQGNVLAVAGVYDEPGRTFKVAEGVEFPLPDTTYAYTTTPFIDSYEFFSNIYDGCTANEMGVSCTGAVTTYTTKEISELDPLTENGLAEAFLCRLVAMCASTAREGVEVLGKYVEMFGNGEHNTILIADQNEAWYVEYYTGHEWCAVRMPDDCVAVFGNESMLGAVDVNSEDVICSERLVSLPEEAGLAVFTEDGLIDLFATYSGGADSLGDGSNRRTWYGHVLFAPSTAGEYDTHTRYDLFYKPDELITTKQVFEMTRARFEGTEFCPEENDDVTAMRVIGIERQINIGVVETYPDLPAAMSVVSWVSTANAEHSVYLPVSNLITDTAEAYKYVPAKGGIDEKLAHYNFKRLCALAEQNRARYGAGVRAYWSQVEDQLLADYPDVMALTLKLYNEDPAAAAQYITNYTVGIQNKALNDANTIFNELLWYVIDKTNTQTAPERIVPFVPSLYVEEEEEVEAAA